jgi:hypothetical protein
MFARWSKVLGILPLVGALAGFAGCNNQGASDGRTGNASSELAGTQAEHAHHMKHGHGPAALLGISLKELDLTDAQRATIKEQLEALKPTAEARATHDAARKAVADAVRNGNVDQTSLLAQMTTAKPDRAQLAKAMGVLHDTLTAAQRKELATIVSEKMDKWSAKMAEEHAEHAEHHDGMHGPMGHLLKGIDLSDQQRTDVQAAMQKLAPTDADREAMKTRFENYRTTVKERMVSFQADQFDATAFVAVPDNMPKAGPEMMAEHMVKVVAAVTPILNDAQRAELAKRIEAGPMGHKEQMEEE